MERLTLGATHAHGPSLVTSLADMASDVTHHDQSLDFRYP